MHKGGVSLHRRYLNIKQCRYGNGDEKVVWSAQFKRTIVGADEQARRGCNWQRASGTSVLNEL